jgi:hypothetical protein
MSTDFDTLKSQIMAIMTVKSSSSNDPHGGINNILYTFIVMSLLQWCFKVLPIASEFIKSQIQSYITSKTKNTKILHHLTPFENGKPLEIQSSIVFKRSYKTNNVVSSNGSVSNTNIEYECCDSLLEKMASLNNVKSLEFNKIYYIKHKNEFEMDKNINAKMLHIDINPDGDLQYIEFVLSSTYYTLSDLHEYVNNVVQSSRIKKQNKLGTQLYYFNERVKPLMKDNQGNIIYSNAPDTLHFTMTKFFTNKTINSTFGDKIDIVKERLNWFINNPDWYQRKGIPYTFGLLIHGEPGCGKTSMCKVIANMTKRHIINISLNPYTTKRQLYNLFYEDRIYIEKPGGMNESFIIPIDKRVYIIEDIDCMSDVVLDRELKEKENKMEENSEHKMEEEIEEDMKQYRNSYDNEYDDYNIVSSTTQSSKSTQNIQTKKKAGLTSNDIFGSTQSTKNNLSKIDENLDDKLTLSFLLNLLDGVLETPGRVLIMTTNYPEKLDKALIRPGRVDVNICFKKCTHNTVVQMLKYFYDNLDPELIKDVEFKNSIFTPAEVYQILFKYIHSPEKAIEELVKEP